MNEEVGPQPSGSNGFPATRWTLVQALRRGGPPSEEALTELCRHYWYPIYAFLRREGRFREDAEDLTQGFFAALLVDGTLLRAAPERGRLRTFLLHALRQFLVDQHRFAGRLKRGGGVIHVPVELATGEQRYAAELVDTADPEALYHRAWARTLLSEAQARLRASYALAGKADMLAAIEPHLESEDPAPPYRELATRLRTTETALRLTVFRARRKLRSLIEEEIARTVSDHDEVPLEVRHLMAMLA